MIQFVLNHTLIQLDDIQAGTTLLDFLRLQADLKGTKEGCASGDCGACTVAIASLNTHQEAQEKTYKEPLRYKSLNSCICLLGSLHGKQVITVEGLTTKAKELHPIQQALVDKHASQCGFCTPGFVMSLFAMTKQKNQQGKNYSRPEIIEKLDGNLCRCTGYRPIIEAAEVILKQVYEDDFDKTKQDIIRQLNAISGAQSNHFFIPEHINELTQLIKDFPLARLLAGGTDLALDITQGLQEQDKIIYLGNVKELKKLTLNKNQLIIGAAVSYNDCIEALSAQYPNLKNHLTRLGSPQIRNVGTMGGNIANASPIADMPPALIALDAQLLIQEKRQKKGDSNDNVRHVAINDFYMGYKQTVMQAGEFIREIHIPKKKPNHYFSIYKISKRYADDISAVCAAFYIHFKEGEILSARIAFGGMAATVKRASYCEKALKKQTLSNALLQETQAAILKDFEPLDDVRASREYRLKIAQSCLQRLFLELENL